MRMLIGQLLLLGALAGLPAYAEDEVPLPEFDIEIIVVRHATPDDTELFDTPFAEVESPDTAVEAPPPPELRRFPPLPADTLRLAEVRERLERSTAFAPILHYGWRQPAGAHEAATATSVAGGRLGTSTVGAVRLSLDRFLRLEIDLELDAGTGEFFRMEQARRVRSGQLHYFDHPRFGVIALVSRVAAEPAAP